MRWILFGLLAAGIAASMFTPPGTRVRGDDWGWQEPTLDDEAGDMTLVICTGPTC